MEIDQTNKKEIRIFGLIAFLFFGSLCAIGIWREKVFVTYFFGALSAVGLGHIIFPVFMSPVHRRWLIIAHYIGRIITTIILTLAYYLVITPSGLLKRAFGGPLLPAKPDHNRSTYWVDRSEPVQPKERFFKRF